MAPTCLGDIHPASAPAALHCRRMPSPPLPITTALPELRAALASRRVAVLQAPPGAGKTTAVPTALLDEAWLSGAKIVMLEPRRLAARAAATWMARLRGEQAGDTIGY